MLGDSALTPTFAACAQSDGGSSKGSISLADPTLVIKASSDEGYVGTAGAAGGGRQRRASTGTKADGDGGAENAPPPQFVLVQGSKTYTFVAASAAELAQWVAVLREVQQALLEVQEAAAAASREM